MRTSIRTRLIVIMCAIMVFVIGCTWFLNITFAGSYYIASEKATLIKNFKKLDKILTGDDSESAIIGELESFIYTSTEKVMIAKTDDYRQMPSVFCTNIFKDSASYDETLQYLYWLHLYDLMEEKSFSGSQENYDRWDNESGLFNFNGIKENNYVVREIFNQTYENKDMVLFGLTDNDYLIALRVSMEDIETSVHINSIFLGYMGLIGIALGCVIVLIFSLGFTKPIKDMAKVAHRMTNLDFEAKVHIRSNDELGELASAMNVMSTTLEKTIAELKTANLDLQTDIEKKEKIDEMRKEFLSHVSHELKTPIALIQGYAEGLKENINEDEESKDFYCDVIADEAYKMNQMVKKLLTLNQIEFGNNQIKITRFNIAEMIYYRINASMILFQKKDVTIEFPQQGESWYVWGDEFMIEEVITNYLSNALNHVFESGKIIVRLQRREGSVYTYVYNDGNPIPEEELGKLWTKFYKVDKARTREYGGSGIGLSIVEATMKAHEKQYGVRNKDNGVEFYFELEDASGTSS